MSEIPTVMIQVEGGAITEAEWNRLGDKLKAAWHEHIATAWRDGYGQGRDDEAGNLPLRDYGE
jgi:hypothetical protein